jgi:hypothetical protein
MSASENLSTVRWPTVLRPESGEAEYSRVIWWQDRFASEIVGIRILGGDTIVQSYVVLYCWSRWPHTTLGLRLATFCRVLNPFMTIRI